MAMLDDLLAQAGGSVDLGAIASRLGVDPAQAHGALGQLLPQIADPQVNNEAALSAVGRNTGLDSGVLAMLLPQLLAAVRGSGASGGVLGQVLGGLRGGNAGSVGAGGGGLFGQIAGMLDRDGDGNPLDDIAGMLGRR